MGLALAASPALSQGAMGPGGGAMTPQPRVAPAPQAPVAPPQAPVAAPQMPVAAPIPSNAQPGPTKQPGKANAAGGDFANVESSNRDHIKQVAPTDSTGSPGGAQKILRLINNSETDNGKTATTTTGPANPVASISNQPIPSVNVMVRKQSGAGPVSTAKTDGSGQTTFRQLEPGTYDVALPSVRGGTVSMTTFVNGTPVARTDFPVGSEIGTFTVAKASDTVILKFQTNLGTTPVNGIGGTGGGRFETGTIPSNGVGGTGGGRYTFK